MGKQCNVKARSWRLLFTLTLVGLFLSGCGGSGGEEGASASSPPSAISAPNPTDSTAQLEKLTLTAFPIKNKGTSELTLITGNEQSFIAVGEYSNGQSKVLTEELSLNDWQSSDGELGEFIQSGVLKAKAQGEITVSFSQDSLTSNTVDVKVTDAEITDILVTPSTVRVVKGQNQTLTATATYSNGLSANISDSVDWVSEDESIALITTQDDRGLLKGNLGGTTRITAVKGDVTSNIVSVDVSEAVITALSVEPTTLTLAKGQSKQLIAKAMYSDGNVADITDSVQWQSSYDEVANVNDHGQVNGLNVGNTILLASIGDVISYNSVDVTVSDAVITQLSVEPETITLITGQQQQLTVGATYSDGSYSETISPVNWLYTNNPVANVNPDNQVIGASAGTTTLTAVKEGVSSNTVSVDVSDAVITDINLTPPTVSLAKGQSVTITATATYDDGTRADISDSVTWTVANKQTATVASGLLTGVEFGNTSVTASIDNLTSHTVDVYVTGAVMTGLNLNPPAVGLMIDATQPMTARAVYSDGSYSDVSDSVTWWSPLGGISEIMSLSRDGLVTGLSEGSSRVKASYNGFNTSVEVNVCNGDGSNMIGKCIEAFAFNENLFTSTPSISYLDSLGLGGSTYTSGTDGDYYTFTWAQANALCNKYSELNLFGRTNWSLPSYGEMRGIYNHRPYVRNWNQNTWYWTTTQVDSSLKLGYKYANRWHYSIKAPSGYSFLASCLSQSE